MARDAGMRRCVGIPTDPRAMWRSFVTSQAFGPADSYRR